MELFIKLNIQRFGTTVTASVSETGVDNNNNLSYVYATFTQVAASNTWNSSGSAYYNISCDGKSTGNVSYTFSKGSTKTFSATLGPYYHNQDGSLAAKTVTFVVHGDVNNGNHTLTKSVSFTTIPRYFSSTPSISFRSKTNTSITYNWSTSEACDYIAYHLDGGGAVQVWTGNATSGTFTVSGLTGGTTHSVYATCRRKDSQLSSNSNTVSNITTYKTPTIALSLTASDETSLTIKATPSVAIKSKSWTLKNSGGTTVKTSTSTNASVQFTGLSAGTTYTIYVSCVSNDANGAISSSTYNASYATVAYPTIASVGTAELVIGNAQTISITNPKGRNVTVHMRKEGASSDLQSWTTTTNGNFSFTPTASTLYNSIPAAHNANCTYFLTYSTYTSPSKTGKYKIKETEAPTFTTSNWSYNVSNTYNALTGNDTSVVIKGYSTVNFTVGTAASSNYGATFTGSASGYVYNWGDGTVALTKTTTASIAAKNTNVIKITAYDDRGLSTISTRTLTNGTNYVDYSIPTITSAKTHRANGIDAATTLTLTGRLGYVGKFGTNGVTNTVASIKYKTKPASSSTWSNEYNLTGYTVNTSTGEFSLTDAQIHSNGESGGFAVGTKYNVMIIVRDAQGLLGSATYTVDVTDGKIARDVYQDSNGDYHEGINGRADSSYTQKINGNFKATGSVFTDGQFIKSGGGSWIQDRDMATARNNNSTNNGAYYPVVSQKTVSGNWTIGRLGGEENLKFNYTTDTDYNNNNNVGMQCTLTNGGAFLLPYFAQLGGIRYYGNVITGTSGAAAWVKLGRLVTLGDSSNIMIKVYTGDGYNGASNQNTYFDILIKDGYQSTASATTAMGVTVEGHYQWNKNIKVDVRCTNNTTADVWVYMPWPYWNGHYTVEGRFNSWTHSSAKQTAAPTSGTAQQVRYQTGLNAYPVGAIYLTAVPQSPASIFGGTWQQLQGRYLYASGADGTTGGKQGKDNMSTYTGGNTQSTTLTVDQIPSHSHGGSTGDAGSHHHSMPWVTSGWQRPGNSGSTYSVTGTSGTSYNTGDAGSHHHSITAQGGGKGHTHNVSFVAMYVWQRTA